MGDYFEVGFCMDFRLYFALTTVQISILAEFL